MPRQVWPPPQPLWPWWAALGATLGALEGAAVGAMIGTADGCLFGSEIGLAYGALAGWSFVRLRPRADHGPLWGAAIWLAGAAFVAASGMASASLGSEHEGWVVPLLLLPYLSWLAAMVADVRIAKIGVMRCPGTAPRVIDLDDLTTYQTSPVRKLWFYFLLLAFQDRAREIWLEPDESGYKLRFRVNNSWRELVPLSGHLGTQLADEVRHLGNLEVRNWRLDRLMRRIAFLPLRLSQNGALRVRFGNRPLTTAVSIYSTPRGEAVNLRLPGHSVDADRIRPVLQGVLARREPIHETGINHVRQGLGNCAIATLAMIAGITYTEADAASPNLPALRRGWIKAYLATLERLTQRKWVQVRFYALPRRIDRIRFPDWPVIVIICPRWRWRTAHCIAVKGEFVHDPNLTCAVPVDQYFRGDWRVVSVFQPQDP